MSTYAQAKANHVTAFFTLVMETGNPVSGPKASPRLAAWRRSERKLSARAFVRNVFDF
ncbi:hypothetical protein [Streptosporangium carneum]|uniref:hypothetical protein n=1 Tax=Streptosporangium carneum TaxID=47481 RepID=UPI0022F2CBA9|nr:hypothetical protein [Streptosporangium carneum]